jgi:hypothetical protein
MFDKRTAAARKVSLVSGKENWVAVRTADSEHLAVPIFGRSQGSLDVKSADTKAGVFEPVKRRDTSAGVFEHTATSWVGGHLRGMAEDELISGVCVDSRVAADSVETAAITRENHSVDPIVAGACVSEWDRSAGKRDWVSAAGVAEIPDFDAGIDFAGGDEKVFPTLRHVLEGGDGELGFHFGFEGSAGRTVAVANVET